MVFHIVMLALWLAFDAFMLLMRKLYKYKVRDKAILLAFIFGLWK